MSDLTNVNYARSPTVLTGWLPSEPMQSVF